MDTLSLVPTAKVKKTELEDKIVFTRLPLVKSPKKTNSFPQHLKGNTTAVINDLGGHDIELPTLFEFNIRQSKSSFHEQPDPWSEIPVVNLRLWRADLFQQKSSSLHQYGKYCPLYWVPFYIIRYINRVTCPSWITPDIWLVQTTPLLGHHGLWRGHAVRNYGEFFCVRTKLTH